MKNKKLSFDWLIILILFSNVFNVVVHSCFYEDVHDLINIIINGISFIALLVTLIIVNCSNSKRYSFIAGNKYYKYGYDILSSERMFKGNRKITNNIIKRESINNQENLYTFENDDIYVMYGIVNLLKDRKMIILYKIKMKNKNISYEKEIKSIEKNMKLFLSNNIPEEFSVECIKKVSVDDTHFFVINHVNNNYVVDLYTYYVTIEIHTLGKDFNKNPNGWEKDYEFITKEFTTIEDATNFIDDFIKNDRFYIDN